MTNTHRDLPEALQGLGLTAAQIDRTRVYLASRLELAMQLRRFWLTTSMMLVAFILASSLLAPETSSPQPVVSLVDVVVAKAIPYVGSALCLGLILTFGSLMLAVRRLDESVAQLEASDRVQGRIRHIGRYVAWGMTCGDRIAAWVVPAERP